MSSKHIDFVHGLMTAERLAVGIALLAAVGAGCMSSAPEGIAPSAPAATTVKLDFEHQPLPEIPLPNDIATVIDTSSPTRRRINASMIAATGFERGTRERLDELDGWSIFSPITIPFSGPLDVNSIRAGHRDVHYDPTNNVVYLINIDRQSPEFGKLQPLDLGNGNYPLALKDRNRFWDNDPRAGLVSLMFDEIDEDTNHNGVLDPGEDTDGDGVLDKPNYFPGSQPPSYDPTKPDDPAARTDALVNFYERETNTLILRPVVPLHERTTYAVVVTRRVHDSKGRPVGSPYPWINHSAQTEALQPLPEVLPAGVRLEDVAFAFSFTTQSVETPWKAVRDGLYEIGVQAHLGRDFPGDVTALLPGRDKSSFPNMQYPHLVYAEDWVRALGALGPQLLGLNANSEQYKQLVAGLKYVDYFVIGRYESPQLFPRVAGYCAKPSTDLNAPNDTDLVVQGRTLLPLNDQVWPPDLDRVPAPACAETVYFTLAVPRKEVSARGQGKPVPVALLGHGYTGQRFSIMEFAGYFAEHGMATIAIDGPSHGISLSAANTAQATGVLSLFGLGAFANATLRDRAFDQNGDGLKDTGADFWTSYLFHTRDIVRQFMLDYSQLVRIIRGFDGQRTWNFNLGNDQQPLLAGDFDGDGALDIGGDAPIIMTGGSLGGIMSMLMGGAEPAITTIAPISGGAGYGDVGSRSIQGGVVEAFTLRVMGPLYAGTIDAGTGKMPVKTIVPDLNSLAQHTIGEIDGVQPGDTMVVANLVNGKQGCGLVSPTGQVRASLESDRGDRIRIVVYEGAVQLPQEGCLIAPGASVRGVLDTFQCAQTLPPDAAPPASQTCVGQRTDICAKHQADCYAQGAPLVAVEDGLGKAHATPDLRRLSTIAQTALDPGDPVAFAPHLQREPLVFATGERTGAHALVLTSAGDMNVPAASAATFGRAAGLIDYTHDDPRYGKPDNQVLIDTYTLEAVDNLKRHVDNTGKGVLMDVENFSGGNDIWTPTYSNAPAPLRLDPPLRIGLDSTDPLGGKSAAFFTLVKDTGQHAFDAPGAMLDALHQQCGNSCTTTYDVGKFLINVASDYLVSNGTTLSVDLCHSRGDCPQYLPSPSARDTKTLP
jgi:hypothetical protein